MWDSNETHLDVVLAKIYEFLKVIKSLFMNYNFNNLIFKIQM